MLEAFIPFAAIFALCLISFVVMQKGGIGSAFLGCFLGAVAAVSFIGMAITGIGIFVVG